MLKTLRVYLYFLQKNDLDFFLVDLSQQSPQHYLIFFRMTWNV